jgi:translation initiation factor IF-3
VLGADREMIGVMATKEALKRAQREGLDLIEVSPNANPPVCRITDFGKYKYEQEKKQHEAKKKQKVVALKELKMRPNIAIGDFNIKLKSAEKFLKDGDKVKIIMQFRGREITHVDVGMAVIVKFKDALLEISKIENYPKLEGRSIVMVLSPKGVVAV